MKGKGTGHAAEFLRVVESELIPFVEREYRVDPKFRVLAGSSLGGLFTLYAMLERPGLFQGYIVAQPRRSTGRTGGCSGARRRSPPRRRTLPARLFVSGGGEEHPGYLAAVRRFSDRLREPPLSRACTTSFGSIDGERHAGDQAGELQPRRSLRVRAAGREPQRQVTRSAERLAVPAPEVADGVGELDVDAIARHAERGRQPIAELAATACVVSSAVILPTFLTATKAAGAGRPAEGHGQRRSAGRSSPSAPAFRTAPPAASTDRRAASSARRRPAPARR